MHTDHHQDFPLHKSILEAACIQSGFFLPQVQIDVELPIVTSRRQVRHLHKTFKQVILLSLVVVGGQPVEDASAISADATGLEKSVLSEDSVDLEPSESGHQYSNFIGFTLFPRLTRQNHMLIYSVSLT